MPQVQMVDTTENQPDPTGVEQFFSKLGKSYKDESDRVEIGKLLGEYKKNRNDANAWENLQLGLETSNISPTKRLQTQASLNEIKKNVIEQDKVLNARVKSMQPTKKTQASQPVDEEQRNLMEKVQNDPKFKDASLPEKGRMLVQAGVSKENSKFVLDSYAEEGKKDAARQEVLDKKQAEADVAFFNQEQEKTPVLAQKGQYIRKARQLNKEGVTGGLLDQAFQKAGFLQFNSQGYREYASLAKEMVKNSNIKGVIGSQISQREFEFFRDATISERFSQAANERILDKEELAYQLEELYNNITSDIVKQNNGEIPKNLQALVNEEFKEKSKPLFDQLKEVADQYEFITNVPKGHVLMYDSKTDEPLHVPVDEIPQARKDGAVFK